ncbi:MAG: penicillin-binding protein activator LpoB [Chitinivibrionales bacterium]|nr:penicillin-binding protein activator LpoB [Chitinivibrionales bacterium]MBD3397255.1 penicillin-binding protein activator LpoB [Chitinivibrionales bacterium]
MKRTTLAVVCVASLCLIALAGCGKKVTRVAADSTIDLSGKWNDTDSRLVAEEMLGDCLSRPWYTSKYAGKVPVPTIIVGDIRNKSHEHINVETFVKDMERVLINSGKVEFVANRAEREQLRQEVESQQEHASEETKKEANVEAGADLMLIGSINTIADQEGSKAVMYYQVDLELIDLETHKKLWIGDKKIKKYITRSKTKL